MLLLVDSIAVCMQDWDRSHHSVDDGACIYIDANLSMPSQRSADCRLLLSRLASTVQYSTNSSNVCFFRLWFSPLCCQSSAVAMLHWLAFLPTYSIACSPCSTLQLGQSLVFAARLTSQTLLRVSTE